MEKTSAKTQQFLPFSAIYDDTLILKNGEFRSIILANALNFELKSQEEQDAIIFAFQGFLNSLTFPVQILVRSRQIDLTDYIQKLNKRLDQEANELIRYQIQEYILFITKLISLANIMDKKFFVVIPFRRIVTPQGGLLSGLFGPKKSHLQVSYQEFQKIKEELRQRENVVIAGLQSLGISAAKLNTKQIIDLLFGSYNITEAAREKFTSLEKIGVETAPAPAPSEPAAAAYEPGKAPQQQVKKISGSQSG